MQTATNPQTGEKLVLQNGQWVPAGSSTPSGPVYGPPPSAPKQRDPAQVRLDDLRAREIEQRLNKPDEPKTSANDVKLQQKRASLQSLETQINRVEELYRSGLKDEALGVISSLGEFLPTEENRQFDAASAGLAEQGMSAFRVPGVGAQSDTELRQFVEANRPYASNYDATIEEKLRQLRVRVDATRGEMGLPPAQWLGQEAVPGEQSAPLAPGGMAEQPTQSRNLAEVEAPSGDQMVRSQGTQTVTNPELAGVRGEYLRRLESGQGPGEIIQFLRSAGVTDPKVLQSAVQQVQFRRQNPNVPIANYNTTALDRMDVPLSATESMMNEAAQSPAGAYAMNAGQTASMGLLDEAAGAMGGNAERVNIALQDSQNTNPIASTLGQISGSVMGALGGEAALASRGMAAGVPRALLADVGYGAASGAGMADEGNRLGGALTGAAAAGAGSLGGQALVRGAGSVISPTGGRLSELYEMGARPTVGQRLASANDGRGLSGLLGRAVNATEEAAQSIPFSGAAIQGARQAPREAWQLGAYNKALAEIGKELPKGMKPGTAPYAFTKKAFGEVYEEARSGMRIAPDEELAADVAAIRGKVDTLEEASQRRWDSIIENKLMRRAGSTLEGTEYKKIQSELGEIVRGIRKSQKGDGELADSLEELQGVLDSAARRHSSPEAVAKLDSADAGWAMFVRIRDAAKARGGPAAEFSPNQFDRSVQRNTAGKHSDAYLRGEALMQDYADLGKRLEDRMGNSFTTDRALQAGTLLTGGAAIAEPTTLGVVGLLGALYSPLGRKLASGAMAPRGPKAKAVADAVRKRARIAGATGAGVALSAQKDDDR